MPADDIYQVNNHFEYQGNENVYSWFLKVVSETDQATLRSKLLIFGGQRQAAWLPLHNPSVNFRCVTVRQVYPNNSLPELEADPASGNRSCSPALDHLPGQCSCVVSIYGDTDNPTGSNRGRDFITGQCCADQVDGKFEDGVGSYLQELCDMYVAMTSTFTMGGDSLQIGIYSPSRAKPPTWPVAPSIPPFFWQMLQIRARSLVRTQRRRQPLDPCEVVCNADILPA